jgi:hypothetical protein
MDCVSVHAGDTKADGLILPTDLGKYKGGDKGSGATKASEGRQGSLEDSPREP